MTMRRIVAVALLAAGGMAARSAGPGFVTTTDGVKLAYIDWGGSGDVLVFLPGNGNTAHVFDGFAPRFTDHHRVIGLTHRGYDPSDHPSSGYDRARLATDIRDLLDGLHLARATLIGHSLAGEEMSRFAVLFPDRVDRLVYLDAAYDRVLMNEAMKKMSRHPPREPIPAPTAQDSASVEAFAAYYSRLIGGTYPTSEVAAVSVVDSGGRIVGSRWRPDVGKAIQAGLEQPPYEGIRAPALAIYAVIDSLSDRARRSVGPDSAEVVAAVAAFMVHEDINRSQRDDFHRLVKNSRVVEVHGADHYVFLSHTALVEREIRAFVDQRR